MIAFLSGNITVISENNYIIIVNNGIGYEVIVKDYSIYKTDTKITMWVSTVQREDGITLYGFEHFEQRKLFIKLLCVSGVGPKTAMLILTKYEPIEFYNTISQIHINIKLGATVNITKDIDIKGIGPTTAFKIINTLAKEVLSS